MLLDDVKQLDEQKLEKIKLYSAVVTKKTRVLELCFALPDEIDEELQVKIATLCQQKVKNKFDVQAKFVKDYLDEDIAKNLFIRYTKEEFGFLSTKIDTDKIFVKNDNEVFVITMTVTPEFVQMLEQNEFIAKATQYFDSITNYNVKIKYDVIENTVDMQELMRQTGVMRDTQMTKSLFKPQRKINVDNVEPYINKFAKDKTAQEKIIKEKPQYIIDIIQAEKSVTVCGRVESTKEVVTPNGFIIFKFDIADFTGKIGVVVFSDERIYLKLKEIVVDDELLISGQVSENTYSQELELRASRICKCKILDENYDKKETRPVPDDYVMVVPEPFVLNTQENLFEQKQVPKAMQEKTFVIFDFETTGKSYITNKIIELGAVRLVNGKIVDTFSTMVNPECRIPAEITRLTGITDSMVENAPTFPEIIADFYKFCDGATLVAHNIEFDSGFLKFNTKDSGFVFNHPQIDTLALSRKYFRSLTGGAEAPHNFKLGTLADFFGVRRENAHRAVDDSIMAADVFCKLIELGAEI